MSVTVTLGMTLWNHGIEAPFSIASLIAEKTRLEAAGYEANVILVDNASWDTTGKVAEEAATRNDDVKCLILPAPDSSSLCRNTILDLAHGDDFVAFIDGDIEVIPHSLVSMLRYLEDHPRLAALAMNPVYQTKDRTQVPTYCRFVRNVSREPLMYLCGYGIFRMSLMGWMRFEESGPLGQCGWGSEDDDFWLEMVEAGLDAAYVDDFRYYHTCHSSWPSLTTLGIDPLASFEKRRRYVLDKWTARRPDKVHSGHLTLIQGQHPHA
jgi:glycosyltransferase involved in cell wall biosynthesis